MSSSERRVLDGATLCLTRATHLGVELLERAADDAPHVGVLLAEFGHHLGVVRVREHAQKVVVHQHLPGARAACADADGGDVHRLGDLRG